MSGWRSVEGLGNGPGQQNLAGIIFWLKWVMSSFVGSLSERVHNSVHLCTAQDTSIVSDVDGEKKNNLSFSHMRRATSRCRKTLNDNTISAFNEPTLGT